MWYHFGSLGLSHFFLGFPLFPTGDVWGQESPRLSPGASGQHFSEISLACSEQIALPGLVFVVRDSFVDDTCHPVSLTGQMSPEPMETQRFLKLGACCAGISLPVLPGLLGFVGGRKSWAHQRKRLHSKAFVSRACLV